MEFKEDYVNCFADKPAPKEAESKQGLSPTVWSKKLTRMLNKRSRTASVLNSSEHQNMKSILKKTLKEFSVEYYKPLQPHEKKLQFRTSHLRSSQKQRFRDEINKTIQEKLRESNSMQSGQTETPVNTIFVGKNKVMIKSIVANESQGWRRAGRRKRSRKFSQPLSTLRRCLNRSTCDTKDPSVFSNPSSRKQRTNSLIQVSKSHFGDKSVGSRRFKEDFDSQPASKPSENLSSLDLREPPKPGSEKDTLDLDIQPAQEPPAKELLFSSVVGTTRSLGSKKAGAEEEKAPQLRSHFDEYNLEELKPGAEDRGPTQRVCSTPCQPTRKWQAELIRTTESGEKTQEFTKKTSLDSRQGKQCPGPVPGPRGEAEGEQKQTPKTQNTLNPACFLMPFGKGRPPELTEESGPSRQQFYSASDDLKGKSECGSLRDMETIKESNEPMSYQNSVFGGFNDDSKLGGLTSQKRNSSRGFLKYKQKPNFMSQQNFHQILETGQSFQDFNDADGRRPLSPDETLFSLRTQPKNSKKLQFSENTIISVENWKYYNKQLEESKGYCRSF